MFTHKFAWHAAGMILAAVCWFQPAVACGQVDDTGVGEVAVLGGATFGVGSKPAFMGSAGFEFSRYGMALVEASFMPMGQHTIQPWPERSTVNQSYVYDFGVDFHVRIPVKERWAPYGIVGVGLLWDLVRQDTVNRRDVAVVNHYNQFNGALHTGAGLRYYVKKTWGIRSEVKVIVSKQVYTQMLVGVFYVTPPNWP